MSMKKGIMIRAQLITCLCNYFGMTIAFHELKVFRGKQTNTFSMAKIAIPIIIHRIIQAIRILCFIKDGQPRLVNKWF